MDASAGGLNPMRPIQTDAREKRPSQHVEGLSGTTLEDVAKQHEAQVAVLDNPRRAAE